MASISRMESRGGFSLVELSIVIVIIGLITGGVMAGRTMIRAAELRSIATDIARYSTAIENFRTKFDATPGDMPNATSYWTASTCPGTAAQPSVGTATCDGDGDDRVELIASNGTNEHTRFWQHLANAGMIEGIYTGVPGTGAASDPSTIPGVNIPLSRVEKAGYSVYNYGYYSNDANTYLYDGDYSGTFILGRAWGTVQLSNAAALKPEDQASIDAKIDDGKPVYGKVRSYKNYTNCTSSTATAPTTTYLLSYNWLGCALLYSQAF